MENKYLSRFNRAVEVAKEHFEFVGDYLLIEEIKDEELKSKSGLIISTGSTSQVNGVEADKPTFARVLMVGAGYYDDTTIGGEDKPLESQPGDIILVGKHSIKKFSVFGKLMSYGEASLGLTKESEIQLRFKGQAGYDAFFSALNTEPEKQD